MAGFVMIIEMTLKLTEYRQAKHWALAARKRSHRPALGRGSAILLTVVGLALSWLASADSVLFDSVPGILSKDFPSDGFETGHILEIGDRITLTGTERILGSATVVLSSFAHAENFGRAANYSYPVTLRIYGGGFGSIPGPLLASVTQTCVIPYRPVGWVSNGIAFNLTFNLAQYGILAPDTIVYTVSVDTSHFGKNPTGATGAQAYNLLGFAYSSAGGNCGGLKLGENDPSDIFDSRDSSAFYWDQSAPSGTLRRDRSNALQNTPFAPMVRFQSTTAALPATEIFVTGPTNYSYDGLGHGPGNINVVGSAGTVTSTFSGINGTTYGPNSAAPVSAGIYTITVQVSADASHAAATSFPMVFAISPRPITIRADPISKAFGLPLTLGPVNSGFTAVGLAPSDAIETVTLSATGGTNASDPIGSYLLIPSNATGGQFNPLNYSISYRPGVLSVLSQASIAGGQDVPLMPPWAFLVLPFSVLSLGFRSLWRGQAAKE